MLADVVLVFEPPVLELPEELVDPDVVPVEAVVLPEVVLPEVLVTAVVLPVEPDVVVTVVVVVPVRSTEPVAVPVDAETLVDDADELSLLLPPMDPQPLNARTQAKDAARSTSRRASAPLNRLNNNHSTQSGWPLNSL